MSRTFSKHAAAALMIAISVMLVLAVAALMIIYCNIASAYDQIGIFALMESEAANDSFVEATEKMEYVVGYYPSGTKQRSGSALDTIVETTRKLTLRSIICNLRLRFSIDLGNDPQAWIEAGKGKKLDPIQGDKK